MLHADGPTRLLGLLGPPGPHGPHGPLRPFYAHGSFHADGWTGPFYADGSSCMLVVVE